MNRARLWTSARPHGEAAVDICVCAPRLMVEAWPIRSHEEEGKMHDQLNRNPPTLALRPREARIIFAAMVKADMEAGLLRYSKRRRLVRYAAKIGIAEFEAQLIMAQVRTEAGPNGSVRPLTPEDIRDTLRRAGQYNLTMRKILIATAAAAAVNIITINWLFY